MKTVSETIKEHINKFGKATYIGLETSIPKDIKKEFKIISKGNRHEIKRD